jgi:hypothetical protein
MIKEEAARNKRGTAEVSVTTVIIVMDEFTHVYGILCFSSERAGALFNR